MTYYRLSEDLPLLALESSRWNSFFVKGKVIDSRKSFEFFSQIKFCHFFAIINYFSLSDSLEKPSLKLLASQAWLSFVI